MKIYTISLFGKLSAPKYIFYKDKTYSINGKISSEFIYGNNENITLRSIEDFSGEIGALNRYRVRNSDNNTFRVTNSDSNGIFEFEDIRNGTYILRVKDRLYEVTINSNDAEVIIK